MPAEPNTTQQLPVITWSLSLKTPAALGAKTNYQIDYKRRTTEKQKDARNKLKISSIYGGGKFFHKLKDQLIMSRPFSLFYYITSLHYLHYTILLTTTTLFYYY
jgi:hypothetical protein